MIQFEVKFMNYIIGQAFGYLTAALTVISYQCKTQKKLLIIQTLSTVSICISYLLLGAHSGMVLNVVCVIRNFIFFFREKKWFAHRLWPVALAVVMGVLGALSWNGPASILLIIALMANTLFLSSDNVQNLRKSILVTSTMILIYDAICRVWGGILNESLAICSACVGLLRYKKATPKMD